MLETGIAEVNNAVEENRQRDASNRTIHERSSLVRSQRRRFSNKRTYPEVDMRGRVVDYFATVMKNGEKYGARSVVKMGQSASATYKGSFQYNCMVVPSSTGEGEREICKCHDQMFLWKHLDFEGWSAE